MTAIYVCPLSRLAATVAAARARHVVTLINDGMPVLRPAEIAAENHLHIGINDICEPIEGMVAPGEAHVGRFLDFVARWDRAAPVVVHCWAGVSRSTGAAFSAVCALRPDLDEEEIAWRLRRRSPEATPNRLFVAVADRLLGRDGRMVAAVDRIGRGATCLEGSVFSFAIDE